MDNDCEHRCNHTPRERHLELFRSVTNWLQPGGLLPASLPTGDDPGIIEPDWLSVPMNFSGYDANRELGMVERTGLAVDSAAIEDEDEDGIALPFLWVVARVADHVT